MKVLIIIPAYNEGKNISLLLNKLNEYGYDVLVVNDCSKDNTERISRELGVKVLSLPNNLGIGGAVQTGYKYAYYNDYDIAIQVDGDGQHNPEYMGELIKSLNEGNNMVIGSRFLNKEGFQSSFARRIGIRYFSNLIKILCGQAITDPTSGFRACDRKVIEYFSREYPVDYPEPETIVMLKKRKIKIAEISVIMNERKTGKSSITVVKSIYYMIKVSLAIFIASIEKL